MKQCSVAVQATPVTTRLMPGREAAEPNGQGDARPDSDPSHAYARSLRQRCTDTQTDTYSKESKVVPSWHLLARKGSRISARIMADPLQLFFKFGAACCFGKLKPCLCLWNQ